MVKSHLVDVGTCPSNVFPYEHLKTGMKLLILMFISVCTLYEAEHCESIVWYVTHVCTIFTLPMVSCSLKLVSKYYYPVCVKMLLILSEPKSSTRSVPFY